MTGLRLGWLSTQLFRSIANSETKLFGRERAAQWCPGGLLVDLKGAKQCCMLSLRCAGSGGRVWVLGPYRTFGSASAFVYSTKWNCGDSTTIPGWNLIRRCDCKWGKHIGENAVSFWSGRGDCLTWLNLLLFLKKGGSWLMIEPYQDLTESSVWFVWKLFGRRVMVTLEIREF